MKRAAGFVPAELDIDLSEQNIVDSQLRMLFAVCHPALATEGQICLALRILCGFGIEEIATAFLTNKETINKRLFRAREKLRTEKAELEFPAGEELEPRLETVLLILYLLYNEGYYSEIIILYWGNSIPASMLTRRWNTGSGRLPLREPPRTSRRSSGQ